jgi:hypothetical protein
MSKSPGARQRTTKGTGYNIALKRRTSLMD